MVRQDNYPEAYNLKRHVIEKWPLRTLQISSFFGSLGLTGLGFFTKKIDKRETTWRY